MSAVMCRRHVFVVDVNVIWLLPSNVRCVRCSWRMRNVPLHCLTPLGNCLASALLAHKTKTTTATALGNCARTNKFE